MAEAIFNSITKKHKASSAGLNPGKWLGKKLASTKYVKVCMKEIGINVDNNTSKKLNKKMTSGADKIIVIGEKERWPPYLKKSDNVDYWDIVDPDTEGIVVHRKIRDEIEKRVRRLVRELN